MAHNEQEILDAIETAATGLATTGSNVYVTRVYALPKNVDQAITIRMGLSVPPEDGYQNQAFIDRLFIVYTRIHVRAAEADLDNQLLQIELELFAAMMADITLGLDFVYDTYFSGRAEPEIDDEAEKPTLAVDLEWSVRHRHSLTDPGA